MIENQPKMMCGIPGCLESVEYDLNDTRPWIYHTKGKIQHCAGKNPNCKPTKRQYYPKAAPSSTPKDHMLKEYYGYGYKIKRVEDEEEIQEEDR